MIKKYKYIIYDEEIDNYVVLTKICIFGMPIFSSEVGFPTLEEAEAANKPVGFAIPNTPKKKKNGRNKKC